MHRTDERRRETIRNLLAAIALSALALDTAPAADLGAVPPKSSVAIRLYDWTGFYVGGHVGYGFGTFGPNAYPLPLQGLIFPNSLTGLAGGYQLGANLQLGNRVVLGAEGDIIFMGPLDRTKLQPAPFNTTFDYVGTLRGRIGYAFGPLLPYATGGFAFGQTRVAVNGAGSDNASKAWMQYGWTAGGGIEVALGDRWSGKLEYNYIDLGDRTYRFDDPSLSAIRADPNLHVVRLGLNYRLWDTAMQSGGATEIGMPALPHTDDWNIHGQTTFLPQAYPTFRSPYGAPNSLPGSGQGRETWTVDAFLGWRLWQGAEFYFNPELAQGFGIGSTLGLAGFSNGEAQKGGAEYPKFRPLRYIVRQTFGLGGEQEEVADGPMQLAGKRDIDRVTVTVGRFAVGDFFDGNAYAKDPRADFMNWAMWASAAYDFPADLPGFTRGAVVELNRKDWTLRAGLFQVPSEPNSDVLTFKTGGSVVELEQRYAIFDQPGKLRLGAFVNRGNTGNYRQALGIEATDPTLDLNDVMSSIRRIRTKYGFYVNAEQQIATDIGVFARASWNDGQNEILSFTDVDRSVSGGISIKGSRWARPNDTIGFGGAVNGLSDANRDFLVAGGNGLLIGDGRLNYRTERILEAYYAFTLDKSTVLTADFQLVANPAYNADRGPVSIFSGRVHSEF